jgi:hypothetical protein
MERETDQGSTGLRREPASWVTEEHVITECYPVFPTHVVDYPHIDGHPDAQLNVSYLVNTACRQIANSRSRVTGGRGREGVPLHADSYNAIVWSLSAFAPLHTSSAYDTVMRILEEYPRNDGIDYLRGLIDGTPITNCRACAAEFDVRLPHRCAPRDLSRNSRVVAKAYRAFDRAMGSLVR